ncbi:MAG TPA: aquaporin [Thermoplasmata archaeon]|nr:aquaporin [Thermoplasmata archaeon]
MVWHTGQRYLAEFLGTFGIVLAVGGAAVFSHAALGLDPLSRVLLVSLTVGFALLGMIYALGEISGGHFNPAVSLSMLLSRKMAPRDFVPYLVAQVLGGIFAMLVVLGLAAGGSAASYTDAQTIALASQCYAGNGSPCTFSLAAVFLFELVFTFLLVFVIHLVTRPEAAAKNLAPVAIALTLTVTNLVGIPVDGASINPARSLAPALISAVWPGAQWAITQVWVFWVAPLLGGVLASFAEWYLRPRT